VNGRCARPRIAGPEGEVVPVWLFVGVFAVIMIALGVIGTSIDGMFFLTVTAAVCLGLIVLFGAWTFTRRDKA
jgi:hypothetical protein